MNSKILFLLLFTYLFLQQTIVGQNNLLNNSSFEDAPSSPSTQSQFNASQNLFTGPDVWESNLDRNNAIDNHSPDWYDITSNIVNTRATFSNGGAHTGNRYAGLHDYELLQQALFNGQSLQSGKAYVISMYFQFSENGPFGGNPFNNSGSTIKVMATKKRLEYNSSDGTEECTSDYVSYSNGSAQSIREIASFPINTTTYPLGGGWYKLQQVFIAPSGHDILGFEADVYDWISFDLVNDNYSDQGHGSSCFKSYILLDDVSLTEYCSHDCAPQLGAISHGTLTTAMNGGDWNYAYKLLMTNVMGFEFEVYGRWSAGVPVYHFSTFSSDGLKDFGYSDYLFAWFGKNDQGNGLQQGTYDLWVKMWNCNDEIVYNNYALFIDGGSSTTYGGNLYAQNYQLPSCCIINKHVQNITFTADEDINTLEYLIAGENVTTGPTGPVIIQHHVNFVSENYVELNPGFSTLAGVFTAEIASCDEFYKQRPLTNRLDSQFNQKENKTNLTIFPNPTNGIINISSSIFTEDIFMITLYDIQGNKIASVENPHFLKGSLLINLEKYKLAPGIYFVQLISSNEIFSAKFIYE